MSTPAWFDPSHFTNLFEPIPEEDPVEKVARWLDQWSDTKLENTMTAQALLAAGLDVERLK